jgi:uncharacterized membrane protein YphA (DoxX/SURF4 family)
MNTERLPAYAGPVLRFGLAFVLLFFAIQQFRFPDDFTGYVPSFLPIPAVPFVYTNAALEVTLTAGLVLGLWTRVVATIAAVHMASIVVAVTLGGGFDLIAARNVGLLTASVASALLGPDEWTMDAKRAKKTTENN